MHAHAQALATPEHRVRISILWVCVVLNIILADIVGFLHPGVLERIITGSVGFTLTQELLLVFSVLLQIPVAMVFLSRILAPRANRWLNTAAVLLTALFVVGGGSGTLSYVFFASLEMVAMLGILWYTWHTPTRAG